MTERSLMGLYEWANRLLEENPHGIGEALKEYAEAWERDTNGILRTSSNCNHSCTFHRQDDGVTKMNDWRPIETAPKDGTYVILWLRAPFSRFEIARWSDKFDAWIEEFESTEEGVIGNLVPTHWMPVPQPPKDA